MKREFGDTPGFDTRSSAETPGFARVSNSLALDARGDYILLLNPDTVGLQRSSDLKTASGESEHSFWTGI